MGKPVKEKEGSASVLFGRKRGLSYGKEARAPFCFLFVLFLSVAALKD